MTQINYHFKLNTIFVLILLGCFATPAFSLMDPHMQSPIPDTGQTGDYTTTFGEDSDYNFNPMSFTKLDASGASLPDSASDWAMVKDNVTGLIWEAKKAHDYTPDYNNIHDADNTYTWYDINPDTNGGVEGTPGDKTDTLDFINAMNSEKLGGFADWRMPTKQELNSILNLGRSNPAVDTTYFSNTAPSYYWTANTVAAFPDNAWKVDFTDGVEYYHPKSSDGYHVRAVRGGQSRLSGSSIANSNFIISSDNTTVLYSFPEK
ncbi:MAG: DUF1566 domain-containing protein [Desulfamplus sp.]|nr:DUF1566 domain-containing protein [Desulfamplus sp.]